jgi:hypothetical protein
LEALVARASRAPDFDAAALILASVLLDESTSRAALCGTVPLDQRSQYILFGGHWGSHATVAKEKRTMWARILVEAVAAKPTLIRSVSRADRYEAFIVSKEGRGSGSVFPYFSASSYADDMAEYLIEGLRKHSGKPAEPVLLRSHHVARTAEEVEFGLLVAWQMVCGLCDRLDLIAGSTSKNWRARFGDLDAWFQRNRPYVFWDDAGCCIAIDREAEERGIPTERSSRAIPKLRPPWLPDDPVKGPPPRG